MLVDSLVRKINTRARLFDAYGKVVVDSRLRGVGGSPVRFRILPPLDDQGPVEGFIDDVYDFIELWLRRDLPLYIESPDETAASYEEVMLALNQALPGHAERRTLDDTVLLTVRRTGAAVPADCRRPDAVVRHRRYRQGRP